MGRIIIVDLNLQRINQEARGDSTVWPPQVGVGASGTGGAGKLGGEREWL